MTKDKFTWRPDGKPLTAETRAFIAEHERLHMKFGPPLHIVDRERMLARIAAFERGDTDEVPAHGGPSAEANLAAKEVDFTAVVADVFAPHADKPTPLKRKYLVHWGWMLQRTEEFTDFERALAYYADHKGGPCGARMTGEGYDADHDEDGFREVSDGLTDEERERVEAVP